MKLVRVIPIARGVAKEELSYFSADPPSPGALVLIPLRSRTVSGLVTEVQEVSHAKTDLKRSPYTLRKITGHMREPLLLPAYLHAVDRAARYYATTRGAVLYATLPIPLIADLIRSRAARATPVSLTHPLRNDLTIEKLLLQGAESERLEQYKNLVREEFARRKSVIVCVPTLKEGERVAESLERGIEKYTILLHGSLPKKEMKARFERAAGEHHPMLLIMTGLFLCLPRSDIGTIILERESAQSYKMNSRPYLDIRLFAEFLAEECSARFLLCDLPLRVETMFRFKERTLEEYAPLKNRIDMPSVAIVNMARKPDETEKKKRDKSFSVLSPKLLTLIREVTARGERMFLFAARRGLSPITVCLDCGSPVTCEDSSIPAVLHRGTRGNVFVCHATGAVRSAQENCKQCGSWKLEAFGIGTQLVTETLRKEFPKTNIVTLDRDTALSHKDATKTTAAFYAAKGSIMIGTEMALSYLTKGIAGSAVVSIDSLLSLPEWNAYERVFNILMRMAAITDDTFLIQTRKSGQYVLDCVEQGTIADFYRQELEERKRFGYPPHATLIKITAEGTSTQAQSDIEEIERLLLPTELSGISQVLRTPKGTYRIHGFLKLPRGVWPEETLRNKLSSLSPRITVTIDPESIL